MPCEETKAKIAYLIACQFLSIVLFPQSSVGGSWYLFRPCEYIWIMIMLVRPGVLAMSLRSLSFLVESQLIIVQNASFILSGYKILGAPILERLELGL